MTAFAAILGRGSSPHGTAAVAAALSRTGGTSAVELGLDGVALIAAPMPGTNPPLFVDPRSGISAVGQVLLEEHDALAVALGLSPGASAVSLAVAAYLRWGSTFSERLSGEFALVLWDPRDRTMVGARDGLGLRPLYSAVGHGVVVFTNTLAAALAHPSVPHTLDERCLVRFLVEGSPDEGRTAYRAVIPLPPGHTLILPEDRSAASLRRHWYFPHGTGRKERRDRDVLDEYREVLQAAVHDRLRTTRAAIFLSGGLDSTTIAAAAKAAAPSLDLRAVTAVYERVPEVSELGLARAAATRLGIPLAPIVGDRYDAMYEVTGARPVPQPVDEPALADWRALVGAAAAHSSVALYGEDGDSLFLPPGYTALRLEMRLLPLLAGIWRYARTEYRLPYLGLRVRERLHLTPGLSPGGWPAWLTGQARTLLAPRELPDLFDRRPSPLPAHPSRPRTQQRLGAGVAGYLSTIISPEVTGHQIELRCPLLDTRVIKYVMDVPPIPWCQQKRLPRDAYRGLLPAAVLSRPKQGVAGLHEALVRDWQRARPRRAPLLRPPLDQWIEPAAWERALNAQDPAAVAAAWRGLQLAAWLDCRIGTTAVEDEMCTA